MIVKQVEFRDFDFTDELHLGILLYDGNLVCACCGGIFEADERGKEWEVCRVLNDWVNFEEYIKE